ncbi:hypothetical protein IQ06DRAFT_22124 [Phaeosphaeriaceae sp. SRC1lsM3a]|nr:hypothetical protein IQ06DRAFT_22124 [Stagonospora sp. SRC1lsM3a]
MRAAAAVVAESRIMTLFINILFTIEHIYIGHHQQQALRKRKEVPSLFYSFASLSLLLCPLFPRYGRRKRRGLCAYTGRVLCKAL